MDQVVYAVQWFNGLSFDEEYAGTLCVTLSEEKAKEEVTRLTEEYKLEKEQYAKLCSKVKAFGRCLSKEDSDEMRRLSKHWMDDRRGNDHYFYTAFKLI